MSFVIIINMVLIDAVLLTRRLNYKLDNLFS